MRFAHSLISIRELDQAFRLFFQAFRNTACENISKIPAEQIVETCRNHIAPLAGNIFCRPLARIADTHSFDLAIKYKDIIKRTIKDVGPDTACENIIEEDFNVMACRALVRKADFNRLCRLLDGVQTYPTEATSQIIEAFFGAQNSHETLSIEELNILSEYNSFPFVYELRSLTVEFPQLLKKLCKEGHPEEVMKVVAKMSLPAKDDLLQELEDVLIGIFEAKGTFDSRAAIQEHIKTSIFGLV